MRRDDNAIYVAQGSGRWFPGTRSDLHGAVMEYMDEAKIPELSGPVQAVIAPHAGYPFSGPVAGYAFRALAASGERFGRPETVVILGFSHRERFRGAALLPGVAYETPLGAAPLDQDAVRDMTDGTNRLFCDDRPHRLEHSAENQVPFVQAALPEAKLVVALFGDQDDETRRDMVAALDALAAGKNIVVVASTDLLHDPDYEKVSRTDRETLSTITALDDERLANAWSPRFQPCCGIAPVLTAIRYARGRGCCRGVVLHYRNSGDDFPESRGEWVVGYAAVSFSSVS